MPSYRPQRATGKGDANHMIVRDYLRDRCGGFITAPKEVRGGSMGYAANYRGHLVTALDLSKFGGLLPDWLVACNGRVVLVEIKTPEAYAKINNNLTAGEAWTHEYIGLRIICADEHVGEILDDLIS